MDGSRRMELETAIGNRLGDLLGASPVTWKPITRHGATSNERWVVRLDDGRRLFVKMAVDDATARWIRSEHRMYSYLRTLQVGFVPKLIGWIDDSLPALLLEDLTHAVWPPPWNTTAIAAVQATLAEVAAVPPPPGLPRLNEMRDTFAGWRQVAEDPDPFLSLGLCGSRWLGDALPTLLEASDRATLSGDALLHLDVRSDNLCLRDGRAVLIDWNWATVGNPLVDIVTWLPSLHAEGGPAPDEILPNQGPLVAFFAGYWAARAGLPGPPRARALQLMQLQVALPWACRALKLPPPTK